MHPLKYISAVDIGKCGNVFTDGFALAKWCRRL